jgi:two-component system NarL family sensor kinase
MAERAEIVGGRLNIRSRPGSGTAVTATIPLPSPSRDGPTREQGNANTP